MAAVAICRQLSTKTCKNRIIGDRTNQFNVFDDRDIFKKFSFHRMEIITITESVSDDFELANRKESWTRPSLGLG